MRVIVKDIDILMAMHDVDCDEDLDHAGFKFGWNEEMYDACGRIFDINKDWDVYADHVMIEGYMWYNNYIIKLEDI